MNLRKELGKCKDELKMRIKYEGNIDALDKILRKQKNSKEIEGVGFDIGQCTKGEDSSSKEIHFTSSSENGNKQTFRVSKPTERKTYVTATKNRHADPKGKAKVDNGGFIKVKDTRNNSRRPSYAILRRPMRNTFNNTWYSPQFNSYCNKCNTYSHRFVDCKLMHKSPPSYESSNPFVSFRNVDIVCYHCNGVGHRSYKCRRKVS